MDSQQQLTFPVNLTDACIAILNSQYVWIVWKRIIEYILYGFLLLGCTPTVCDYDTY